MAQFSKSPSSMILDTTVSEDSDSQEDSQELAKTEKKQSSKPD